MYHFHHLFIYSKHYLKGKELDEILIKDTKISGINEEIVENLQVINWNEPSNNDFFLASQFWISEDMYKRRADLVGFVNGLPLVFIELKASHKRLEHAYRDNLRDYKKTIPQIFWYNGFIILSNGSQSKIGSMTAQWEHFAEWKKINSEGEEGIVKLVAKNHQYLGVNNATEALKQIENNSGRLGVFWHTQGSGKSYSMVFFSQKVLRKIPGNFTFVIVTDRQDLDNQIYKNFAGTGKTTTIITKIVYTVEKENIAEIIKYLNY